MPEDQTAFDERFRVLHIIVGSLILGVVLFAAVAAWLITSGTFVGTGPPVPLEAVGVGVVALIFLAPVLAGRTKEAPPDADRDTVFMQFQTGTIVGMALREGAGLMGGVFALLAGSLPWLVGLTGASVLAMALAWPKRDDLDERLRRARS